MNFAVPFFKMLKLYMLWRAQFLSELQATACHLLHLSDPDLLDIIGKNLGPEDIPKS